MMNCKSRASRLTWSLLLSIALIVSPTIGLQAAENSPAATANKKTFGSYLMDAAVGLPGKPNLLDRMKFSVKHTKEVAILTEGVAKAGANPALETLQKSLLADEVASGLNRAIYTSESIAKEQDYLVKLADAKSLGKACKFLKWVSIGLKAVKPIELHLATGKAKTEDEYVNARDEFARQAAKGTDDLLGGLIGGFFGTAGGPIGSAVGSVVGSRVVEVLIDLSILGDKFAWLGETISANNRNTLKGQLGFGNLPEDLKVPGICPVDRASKVHDILHYMGIEGAADMAKQWLNERLTPGELERLRLPENNAELIWTWGFLNLPSKRLDKGLRPGRWREFPPEDLALLLQALRKEGVILTLPDGQGTTVVVGSYDPNEKTGSGGWARLYPRPAHPPRRDPRDQITTGPPRIDSTFWETLRRRDRTTGDNIGLDWRQTLGGRGTGRSRLFDNRRAGDSQGTGPGSTSGTKGADNRGILSTTPSLDSAREELNKLQESLK